MEKSRSIALQAYWEFVTVSIPCFLILIYQRITFGFRPTCRFYPSCSTYMKHAIQEWGFFKGFWYGVGRLLKCHPWHEGGYDPVIQIKNGVDDYGK